MMLKRPTVSRRRYLLWWIDTSPPFVHVRRGKPAKPPTGRGALGGPTVYPVKLLDSYPCRGIDAEGQAVIFGDLLARGDKVGPPEDPEGFVADPTGGWAAYTDGIVVERDDGLWVEALPEHGDRPG